MFRFDRHAPRLASGLLLLILVTLGANPATNRLFERLDLVIYDLLLPTQSPAMSEKITVIAIDDRSLRALGRWPWDRQLHAQLINRLMDLDAKVIGVDILLSEYQDDGSEADILLAEAIRAGRVVLPVAPARQAGSELISELLPIPELAAAATSLGHVDVELDIDGLCRSTFLYGGIGEARWPSLALAMLQTANDPNWQAYVPVIKPQFQSGWTRASQQLIPFTAAADGVRVVSFSDVLSNRVEAQAIADKFVLVGATATGLGDAISTPGALSHERMPGVTLNAQILNGLLQQQMISRLDGMTRMLLSAFLVGGSILAIMLLPLRFTLASMLAGLGIIVVITAYLLSIQGLWYPPASALIAVLLAWPAWTAWQYQHEKNLRDRLLLQLEHQTQHHTATGLPNHGMLEDRLRSLMAEPAEHGTCALLVLHINWPGSASIVLDRPISDPVLQAIRDQLKAITRAEDFVAHLNGDDFAVLATGFDNADQARQGAADFLNAIQQPLTYGNERLLLAPQIGVSLWPSDTNDPHELLRNAYTAMFKSRIDETQHLCIYSATVGDELQSRSQLEQALVYALERHEFEMYYQPQVAAKSGKIVGVEALLRWHNPLLGWVSPAAFVPVAEHVGLIKSIGAWVIEDTCRQLQSWNKAGFGDLRLAINISPLQFLVPGLETEIQQIVQRIGIDPSSVELEITESSLMHDIKNAVRVMQEMKAFGLELAIDDFGTGYSSLSSLRHFPVDRLKIDQSFTREIGVSKNAEEITLTIIAMARQLGMKIIAEGVENEAQASFLRQHGCDEFQGFLFARPMPAAELTRLLENELVQRF